MPDRQNISSPSQFEPVYGYSRAVRVGSSIHVSGTTASDDQGTIYGAGDMYAQTMYIIQKIERALQEAGASLADVVRTRTYVTDITRWQEVARAHSEYFGDIRPASTLVEVRALITPELLVEMEVDAIIAEQA